MNMFGPAETNNFTQVCDKPKLTCHRAEKDMASLVVENARLNKELNALAKAKIESQFVEIPKTGIGDLSDGYHTFNELYHHRAVLFSVICNQNNDKAWKSKQHSDGTMFDGMFIVGIETPQGQATYHYDIEPYWSMFDVEELDKAPEWDGHTPDDAAGRLFFLGKGW